VIVVLNGTPVSASCVLVAGKTVTLGAAPPVPPLLLDVLVLDVLVLVLDVLVLVLDVLVPVLDVDPEALEVELDVAVLELEPDVLVDPDELAAPPEDASGTPPVTPKMRLQPPSAAHSSGEARARLRVMTFDPRAARGPGPRERARPTCRDVQGRAAAGGGAADLAPGPPRLLGWRLSGRAPSASSRGPSL
jgi:pyruvate/2-oxoglutarate dehydrogenase complex dihydrolipoamide acyltransferase (E2) component